MGCTAFKHRSKQTSPQAHVISPTNTESPMESKLTHLFENLQTQMNNTFTSLSTKIEKVKKSVQPTPSGADPKVKQGGVFGTPAVVNAPLVNRKFRTSTLPQNTYFGHQLHLLV